MSLAGQLQTVAWLEIRQMLGGKLVAIGGLLGGLAGLAFCARLLVGDEVAAEAVFLIMMNFVFLQTVVILIPLLFATSLIKNELDNGTLVYLVTRPISRPALLLTKFVATTAVSAALVTVGMVAFLIAFLLPGGDPTGGSFAWWSHLFAFIQAGVLGVIGYGALFTLFGLVFKRGLIWGLAYGFISEFILTNLPMLMRKFTIMHYLRSVALTGLDLRRFEGIDEEDVKEITDVLLDLVSSGRALLTVLGVAAVCLILAVAIIATRELTAEPIAME